MQAGRGEERDIGQVDDDEARSPECGDSVIELDAGRGLSVRVDFADEGQDHSVGGRCDAGVRFDEVAHSLFLVPRDGDGWSAGTARDADRGLSRPGRVVHAGLDQPNRHGGRMNVSPPVV
jgi:hypothetical protein